MVAPPLLEDFLLPHLHFQHLLLPAAPTPAVPLAVPSQSPIPLLPLGPAPCHGQSVYSSAISYLFGTVFHVFCAFASLDVPSVLCLSIVVAVVACVILVVVVAAVVCLARAMRRK